MALAGVQRGVHPDRHQGVLQVGAGDRVGVRVAGGDQLDPQPLGQLGEQPVAAGVAAPVGALQLDREPLAAEHRPQRPGGVLGLAQPALADQPGDVPVAGAAGQAVQPLGVGRELLERRRRCPAVVGVRQRDQPAEVAVAPLVLGEQRHVRAVGQRQLAAGDRAQAGVAGCAGELHRPAEAVVVGQGEGVVAQLGGALGDLDRLGGAVQERVAGVGVQLGVGHARCAYQRRRCRSRKTTVLRPSSSTRSK